MYTLECKKASECKEDILKNIFVVTIFSNRTFTKPNALTFTKLISITLLECFQICGPFLTNSSQHLRSFNPITSYKYNIILRNRCPYSELFWSSFSRIRTRITPKTDTFYAVSVWDRDLHFEKI